MGDLDEVVADESCPHNRVLKQSGRYTSRDDIVSAGMFDVFFSGNSLCQLDIRPVVLWIIFSIAVISPTS